VSEPGEPRGRSRSPEGEKCRKRALLRPGRWLSKRSWISFYVMQETFSHERTTTKGSMCWW
jgi:hypothetical protein